MEMKHVGGWQIGHVHIRDEVHSTHHIEAADYFAVFKHDLGMARLLSGSPYMVMPGSTLPYELLVDIFGHLSPSHLAQVSSVCHYWRKAAFPRLYHTVYLCLATHLDEFVQRVHTDDAGSQFSIVTHLRGLVLDIEYLNTREAEMIKESDVGSLDAIIPRLTHLKYLSWNLMFVPQNPATFRLFQNDCPKLDSVHIWIYDCFDFFCNEYDMLLGFQNLSHFCLSIRDMPPTSDDDNFEALNLLLGRCPQLSSILLDFSYDEFGYSPITLIGALGSQCLFPCLQRFYARGGEDPDWIDFFDNPNENPLRQFFVRHPQIEDLALGYANESCYYNDIDPAGIAKLFPSLRYFEGPVFLIPPLVQSCLAEQLEELVLSDSWLRDEVDLATKIYGKVLTLPKLRKFGIWADMVNEGILVNMLQIIVKGANQLEEIEIHHDIDNADYGDVMSLITQVHGLRSITLSDSILRIADENHGEEDLGWAVFASNLRRACPKLRTIYQAIRKFDKENREKVWELSDYP